MKTIKIFSSLLLASAFLVGCSDDDLVMNSTSATVGFENSELTIKESADMLTIPVVVSGEQDGAVNVTLTVKEYGKNAAVEDVNYIVTDKTLTISPDEKEVDFEVRIIDNEEINEARTFVVEITNANGAKVDESKNTLLVTVKDNDANFYEKLGGGWNFSSDMGPCKSKITIYPEDDPLYEKEMILLVEFQGIPLQFNMTYEYDAADKKIKMSIPLGKLVFEEIDFGFAVCDVYSGVFADGNVSIEGTIECEVSEDMRTIKLDDSNGALAGLLFLTGTNDFAGKLWFAFGGASLTR